MITVKVLGSNHGAQLIRMKKEIMYLEKGLMEPKQLASVMILNIVRYPQGVRTLHNLWTIRRFIRIYIYRDYLKMDRKAPFKFSKKISVNKYAKTALKLLIAMSNCKLPTKYQLNIFIFEARANLWTLLKSLKQRQKVGPGRECPKYSLITVD